MPTTSGPPSPAQGTAECRQRPQDDEHPTFEGVCSTQGVREVCSARGIEPSVRLAIQLARSAFGPLHELRAEVDEDPDTDERRVVLDVTVDAPADELLRRYHDYTREWVKAVPADAREWVRLSFHPLRDA